LSLLFPAFAPRRVGIAAIVTQQMFMVSGNVGAHPGDPVQRIHGASRIFGGAVLDLRVIGRVTQPRPSEAGA